MHNSRLIKLALLTQLCLFATLLTPYGFKLWAELLTVGSHPNFESISDWHPLTLREFRGQLVAALGLGIFAATRFSRRSPSTSESLLLVSLAVIGCWNSSQIVWFYPVALWTIATHWSLAMSAKGWTVNVSPRSGKWSVVMVGLIWIFFGYSPLGMRVIHGKQPAPDRLVSEFAPIELTDYLNKKPPLGLVFTPVEWGDYLLNQGPKGIQVFANSQIQYLPREVWRDYLTIIDQGTGWSDIIDRYSINTVVLDKALRDSLIRRMKEESAWKMVYEDGRGAIFQRRIPIER